MAKTYTTVGWEDGTVIKKASVNIDGKEYEVEPELISGTTPINSTNLRHMDDAIKDLYDGGASSADIVISPEQPTGDDWKVWIPSDQVENISEVVDSLDGDYKNLAPSVRAVKEENTIVKVEPSDIITLNSGFSFLSDHIYPMYKQGKHYWGYAVISSTGNFSNSQSLVGSFKVDVYGVTNSYCILSSDEWSSTNIGYLYYTKSVIYIADHNNAGKNVAKVFLDFVVN